MFSLRKNWPLLLLPFLFAAQVVAQKATIVLELANGQPSNPKQYDDIYQLPDMPLFFVGKKIGEQIKYALFDQRGKALTDFKFIPTPDTIDMEDFDSGISYIIPTELKVGRLLAKEYETFRTTDGTYCYLFSYDGKELLGHYKHIYKHRYTDALIAEKGNSYALFTTTGKQLSTIKYNIRTINQLNPSFKAQGSSIFFDFASIIVAQNKRVGALYLVDGEQIIPCQYDNIYQLYGIPLFFVGKKTGKQIKYALFDRNGKALTDFKFVALYQTIELVNDDDVKLTLSPILQFGRDIYDYRSSALIVSDGVHWGLYMVNSGEQLPMIYNEIKKIENDYFIAEGAYFVANKDGKYALLSSTGQPLTAFDYADITFSYEKKCFIATKANKEVDNIDLKGNIMKD